MEKIWNRWTGPAPLTDRFWSHVDKSGECWLWTAAMRKEYGVFQTYNVYGPGRKMVPAHRMAYALTHGPITDGLVVCHNCPGGDNPRCVRPDHLFLGTISDNTRDAIAKGQMVVRYYPRPAGTTPRGEKHHWAKLTDAQAAEIQRRRLSGDRNIDLAREFGVSTGAVTMICQGKRHKQPN